MPQPHNYETDFGNEMSPFPALCRSCRKMAAFAVDTSVADATRSVVKIQCRACGKKWALGKVVRSKVA